MPDTWFPTGRHARNSARRCHLSLPAAGRNSDRCGIVHRPCHPVGTPPIPPRCTPRPPTPRNGSRTPPGRAQLTAQRPLSPRRGLPSATPISRVQNVCGGRTTRLPHGVRVLLYMHRPPSVAGRPVLHSVCIAVCTLGLLPPRALPPASSASVRQCAELGSLSAPCPWCIDARVAVDMGTRHARQCQPWEAATHSLGAGLQPGRWVGREACGVARRWTIRA